MWSGRKEVAGLTLVVAPVALKVRCAIFATSEDTMPKIAGAAAGVAVGTGTGVEAQGEEAETDTETGVVAQEGEIGTETGAETEIEAGKEAETETREIGARKEAARTGIGAEIGTGTEIGAEIGVKTGIGVRKGAKKEIQGIEVGKEKRIKHRRTKWR